MGDALSFAIRTGGPADFREIMHLWKASVKATHAFVRAEHLAEIAREMPRAYLPAVRELWLCYDAGQERLAGFCGSNGADVEMLFVHPAYMGRGAGSKLLAHVRALHGPLTVSVNEANDAALAFYLNRGFAVAGRSETDGQGRPYPLLHLRQ